MTIVPFLHNLNRIILNPLILLMFGVAFVYAFYGFVRFLSLDAGDKERQEARNAIIWGIAGMVIMFSVYGLIRLVLNSFGINVSNPNVTQIIKS